METLIQNILNGFAIGSVYSLFALGYTLIFSILGVINFAHGAIFVLGAYFTYFLIGEKASFSGILPEFRLPFALPFPLALIISAILAGLVNILIEKLAFKPLRKRNASPLLSLVSSLGISFVIINLLQILFGAENYSFPLNIYGNLPATLPESGPITVRTVQVIIFAVSSLVLFGLVYLLNKTKLGKALKTVAENQITAKLLGISPDKFIILAFFISGFLAAIAGTLIGTSFGIAGPYFGLNFSLKGLAVIILGGLGNIYGAMIAGLIIGLAESFVPADYSGYRDAIAFAILFVILLIKPQGLFGKSVKKV